MRDDTYDEALNRKAEQWTAEELADAARMAAAVGAVLAPIGDAAATLAQFRAPTPEQLAAFDRRMTIELWRRGLLE